MTPDPAVAQFVQRGKHAAEFLSLGTERIVASLEFGHAPGEHRSFGFSTDRRVTGDPQLLAELRYVI